MLSIVIPHHAGEHLLRHCLSALFESLSEEAEVIVVLNNSDPAEVSIDLGAFPVRALRFCRNLGSAGAYQEGIKAAKSDTVVLLDNDVMVNAGWLEPMLKLLNSSQKIGAVSAKMVSPATGRIIDYGIAFTEYNAPHPFFDRKPDFPLATKNRKVQAACSAAMVMRRRAYDAAGGFTRVGTAYYNDIELCLKMNRAGFEVWVCGESTVFHKSSFPGAKVAPYKGAAQKADQKGRFMAEYGHLIQPDMGSYFEESFKAFGCLDRRQEGAILIDLSSVIDRTVHYDWFRKYLSLADQLAFPTYDRDATRVDLMQSLPSDLARTHIPLVYFVDRFTALTDNAYWFHIRPFANDIVVDRNANVLGVSDLAPPDL